MNLQINEHTTIFTDSQYCCSGFAAGLAKQQATFNDDLWARFFTQIQRHEHRVTLIKVKSHLDLHDATAGAILLKDLVGNAMADQAAKLAAADFAVPAKVATKVRGEQEGSLKVLRHLVAANLENLKQLSDLGLREPLHRARRESGPARDPPVASSRGHKIRRISANRWKCTLCLSTRNSAKAHRWPRRCSAVFKDSAAATRLTSPPVADHIFYQSVETSQQVPADRSGKPGAAYPASTTARGLKPLDDSEAEDMDLQEHFSPQLEPPDEQMPEELSTAGQMLSQPSAATVQQTADQVHIPPIPAQPASWWDRIGDLITADELKVGGMLLHPSHRVAHFGNEQHRLIFCLQCGGMTSGMRSELLTQVCRRHPGATRCRQLRRMCLQGKWPEAHQHRWGRAELSAAIRFAPAGQCYRIAPAQTTIGIAATPTVPETASPRL